MAVNQQVVRPVVQEVTEELGVTTAVQRVAVVSLVMVDQEHTELGVLLLPMEETEETTVLMQFVLEVLVAEVVPTVTPVAVAVAAVILVVLVVTTVVPMEAVAVEVPITMEPIKQTLEE
jgi:hypothetical protein